MNADPSSLRIGLPIHHSLRFELPIRHSLRLPIRHSRERGNLVFALVEVAINGSGNNENEIPAFAGMTAKNIEPLAPSHKNKH